jgi:hypothetical protein
MTASQIKVKDEIFNEPLNEKLSSRKDDFSFHKIRFLQKFNKTGVRKMKLHFDLNKEETEGFNNLIGSIKPPEISTNDFVKQMFLVGLNNYMNELERIAQNSQASEVEVSQLPNVEVIN